MSKIIKLKVPADLKGKLSDLIERRNRIVHEAPAEDVKQNDVEDALDACSSLIQYLAEVSDKNNIGLDEYSVFGLEN